MKNASQRGKASVEKGGRGEREFYRALSHYLHPCHAYRLGRNYGQAAKGGADSPPAMAPFSVEIKRRKGPHNLASGKLVNDLTDGHIDAFWKQSVKASGGLIPVVAYKADRQRWRIVVPFKALAPVSDDDDAKATLELKSFAWLLELHWSADSEDDAA